MAGTPRKLGCRSRDTSPAAIVPSPGTPCGSRWHPTGSLAGFLQDHANLPACSSICTSFLVAYSSATQQLQAEVGAVPVLHERDAGVGRHAAPLPCARHVTA